MNRPSFVPWGCFSAFAFVILLVSHLCPAHAQGRGQPRRKPTRRVACGSHRLLGLRRHRRLALANGHAGARRFRGRSAKRRRPQNRRLRGIQLKTKPPANSAKHTGPLESCVCRVEFTLRGRTTTRSRLKLIREPRLVSCISTANLRSAETDMAGLLRRELGKAPERNGTPAPGLGAVRTGRKDDRLKL